MVVSSLAAEFSPDADFGCLVGGAMPKGALSSDGSLHLPSRGSTGHRAVSEEVFETCTW